MKESKFINTSERYLIFYKKLRGANSAIDTIKEINAS